MNKLRIVQDEYESPWSIIENIKMNNFVNTRQFLNTFGSEPAVNTGNLISKRYLNLWTFEGIDDLKFKQTFGESLSDHTESIKNKLTHMFPSYIRPESLFREKLFFCKECIKEGYHSMLHQFKMTEICPYHLSKLEDLCPNCKQSIQYLMPGHHLETGFVCNCGEPLRASQNYHSSSVELTIKEASIANWLILSREHIEILQNTIIFGPFLDQGDKLMQSILKILQSIAVMNTAFYIPVCQTSSPKNSLINQYNNFYYSLVSTLHGYEEYLMKTVMKNHRHCLKRLLGMYKKPGEEFPTICPYAYAYVFWKESFFNINPFIDQYKKTQTNHVSQFELPFHYMNDDFRKLLMFYSSYNARTLTWIINHLLWEVADHHFKEWLGVAEEYAKRKIRPSLEKLTPRTSQSIILFPLNENRIEKFIFNKIIPNSLHCPYENESKINDGEISFLPMRLAINDGNNEEKKAAERYLKRLRSAPAIINTSRRDNLTGNPCFTKTRGEDSTAISVQANGVV